jgi:outer membrane protein TolC
MAGCARLALNPETEPAEHYIPADLLALAAPPTGAGQELEPFDLTTSESMVIADLPTTMTQYAPPGEQRPLTLDEVASCVLAQSRALALEWDNQRIAALEVPAQYGIYDANAQANLQFAHTESAGGANNLRQAAVALTQLLPTGATLDLHAESSRSADEGPATPDYGQQTGALLRQPLLRGRGVETTEVELRRARIMRGQARFTYQATVRDKLAEALRLYWQWRGAMETWQARVWALAAARELVRVTRSQVEEEVVPITEQLQAEATAAARYVEVIEARRTIADLADRLRFAMGLNYATGEWQGMLVPGEAFIAEPPAASADNTLPGQSVAEAQRNRPEAQRAALEVRLTELDLRVARQARRPQLDGFARIDWSGNGTNFGNARDDLGSGRNNKWAGGLEWSYPLQNRAARYRTKQAEAACERARQERADIGDQVAQEVRAAQRALGTARDSLAVAHKRIESARENLRVALEFYRAGVDFNAASNIAAIVAETATEGTFPTVPLSPAFTLLSFQSDYEEARIALVQAMVDLQIAQINLVRSMGGTGR